ncbi:uncharacterized protein BDV17DRAFT_215079 [Aspergillus undulatus]|uniref:uncharacterized protein n=1 Tax=Aspergillus undulatus TaxID=1810928 RepID=UPI003CCE150B
MDQRLFIEEYVPAKGLISALLIHFITKVVIILLAVPLFRGPLRIFVDPRKSLPDQEELRGLGRAEYRAIGMIQGDKPVVRACFLRQGALYEFTASLTCVGVEILLNKRQGRERAGRGGFFTPSSLGLEYVEGLRNAGVRIEVEDVDLLAV